MRELKFRAWDKHRGEWVSIGFHLLGEEMMAGYLFKRPLVALNDLVVTQYTGLKDKNGKEIYEGDVVVFNDTFYHPKPEVVEWFDGAAGFSPFIDADEAEGLAICPESNQCEVIGNVYEHPELVRGKA